MAIVRYDTARLNAIEFSLVAERYGRVKKVGANLYAECPWHDDKNPSLLIGGRRGNFCHCFSCGRSGSVIDYVMAVKGVGFKEACEMLDPLCPLGSSPSMGSICRQHSLPDGAPHRGGAVRRTEGVYNAPLSYIPMQYLEEHIGADNTFCNCLRSFFTEEGVQWVVNEYKLGSYRLGEKDGFVMFPSIDVEGRVHNIKIQRYCDDRESPRFFHKEEKSTYWLGSILAKRHPEMFTAEGDCVFDSTCFFGEHLLPMYPDLTVVLVESPKNAVVGACEVTGVLWIAVGNKNNLTRKRLECLRGRKVIVIPDADAVEEWRGILSKMRDIATFCFSSFCETALGEVGKKGDVADWIVMGERH